MRLGVSGAAWRAHKAGAVVRPLGSGTRAGHGSARSGRRLGAGASGKERGKGGKGGKKRKKRKKGEGKKEKKIEKERKWGKREERKEKGGGAVRASGDRGRGRPR